MTITPENQPHTPQLQINLDDIASDTTFVRTRICRQCQIPVTILTIDIQRLSAEVGRLHSALISERLISANLRAAIRAALSAQSDGESDPLAYLRDELPETGNPGVSGDRGWC